MRDSERGLGPAEVRELDAMRAGGGPVAIDPSAAIAIDLDAPVPPTTAGLTRVTDTRQSFMCKTLRLGDATGSRWDGSANADDPFYWRREALVYAHGLPGRLAGRLRGPRCHGVFDRPDGSVAIWLEDLATTTPGARWPLGRYGEAAFDLGVAQGHAAKHVDRFAPWLSRRACFRQPFPVMSARGSRHPASGC